MYRFYIATLFIVLAMAPAAGAQSVVARSAVEEAFVGEPFTVFVTVMNPSTATMPQSEATPDFEIALDQSVQNPARNEMHQSINGRESHRINYTYTFEVRPSRAGRLKVPAFVVNDGGRSIASQPIAITIKRPSSTANLICTVECKKKGKIYVGQKVDLTLSIWVRKYRQGNIALDVNGTWSLLDRARTALGVFGGDNNPRWGESSRKDESGQIVKYWAYELDAAVYPTKPGPLDLGEIQIVYRYPVQLGQDIFGRLQLENERRLQQRPTMPDVQVVALPLDGRPPDFNGAVGVYSISAQAKPADAAVGDPITLSMAIRGSGSLERLSPPKLEQVDALTRDFEISGEAPGGEIQNGTKLFSRTIRPLREDVTQIPPIPMSFFNTGTGKYETMFSDAIPIKVRPAERLAMPSSNGVGQAQGVLAPLVESTEGLLANETDPYRVLGSQAAVVGPGTWAVVTVSPTAFAAVWLMRRRTERFRTNVGLRRRHAAYRTAAQLLRPANGALSPGQARAAIVGYIADKCNAPAGGMTRSEALRLMSEHGVPPYTLQSADEMLQGFEQAEYGGMGTSVDAGRARTLLDTLERCELQ